MTRTEVFFLALQTWLVKRVTIGPDEALRTLRAACDLEEGALAEVHPVAAALDFGEWQRHGAKTGKEPPWLKAYGERLRDRVVVRASREGAATQWWAQAEQAYEDSRRGAGPAIPESCLPLLLSHDEAVVVTRAEAARFRLWVESVPGHEEEPFKFEEDNI